MHRLNESIPLLYRGLFLGHVVPAIIALRTDILERGVLQPVANFLRHASLSSQRLPGSAQIPVGHDGDHLAFALTLHERVKRAMADGLGWVSRGREKPTSTRREAVSDG